MKFSEAMLKGYESVDGRQCRGNYSIEGRPGVFSYCPIGAAVTAGWTGSTAPFTAVWGVTPIQLNDKENLPWEHIYGMAVAAGL